MTGCALLSSTGRFHGCAMDGLLLGRHRDCALQQPMTARTIPVEIFDLAVFGATGDLSRRKLLPALFERDLQGQIPPGARIIGASRRKLSPEEFRNLAKSSIEDNVPAGDRQPEALERFLGRLQYVSADAGQEDGWSDLE